MAATDIRYEVAAVDLRSAEHYVWGEVCEGWHLLKQSDLSVIRERVPPGRGEVRHVHHRARQFFYILEGVAVIEIDGRRVDLVAGQGLHVPPESRHRFINESNADVHFIVVSAPTTRGDRVDLPELTS